MSNGLVLILGATSDIAVAAAHHFAKAGYDLQLAARSVERLTDDQSNLMVRYQIQVHLHEFDAENLVSHASLITELRHLPDTVICCVGYMGEHTESECDQTDRVTIMRRNYEGPANMLALLADHFEHRGSGCLVGISSVAGLRGRASNYIYGSAKAGFIAYLSGLRNRLHGEGVHVVTVLPGYVDTKMTRDLRLPKALTASPQAVAAAIFNAVNQRKDTIYCLRIWRPIMWMISLIPEFIFKRLKL